MRVLLASKLLVGLGALGYVVTQGCRQASREDANRRPAEALRQAKDLCRQWEKGFAAAVPSRPPALADQLLREVEESGAYEPIRDEARARRAAFGQRPHYLQMAANAAAFRDEADRYLALHAAAGEGPDAIGPGRPGVLVVTVSDGPQVYFDAEAIDACGPSGAAPPDAVRTLIPLNWEKQKIGKYRVTEIRLKGQKVPVRPKTELPPAGDAYQQTCTATALRVPGGVVIGRQRFTAEDPEERGQPTAEAQVRARVGRFLSELPIEAHP